MRTSSSKLTALLREVTVNGKNGDARQCLISALQRLSHHRFVSRQPLDAALKELSKSNDFSWVIGTAYWSLRQKEKSLPIGTIFTPPALTQQVVSRLIPGLEVVDLGAGTGMLTLAAAKQGFKVSTGTNLALTIGSARRLEIPPNQLKAMSYTINRMV